MAGQVFWGCSRPAKKKGLEKCFEGVQGLPKKKKSEGPKVSWTWMVQAFKVGVRPIYGKLSWVWNLWGPLPGPLLDSDQILFQSSFREVAPPPHLYIIYYISYNILYIYVFFFSSLHRRLHKSCEYSPHYWTHALHHSNIIDVAPDLRNVRLHAVPWSFKFWRPVLQSVILQC